MSVHLTTRRKDRDVKTQSGFQIRPTVISLAVGLLAVGLASPSSGKVDVEFYAFPGFEAQNSIWGGLGKDTQDRIYIGVDDNAERSHLYRFDPSDGTMTDLGDVVDHMSGGTRGQGKFHTQIVLGPNGRLYWGTLVGSGKPKEVPYPGGHWMSYDPATGAFEDYGIPVEGQGIITACSDAPRGKVYGLTYPEALFLVLDIATGRTTVHGRMNQQHVPRMLITDSEGNCYGSDEYGMIQKYDAAEDTVGRTNTRLPDLYTTHISGGITAYQALDRGREIYAITSGGMVFQLLPDVPYGARVEIIGHINPDGPRPSYVPNMVITPDRRKLRGMIDGVVMPDGTRARDLRLIEMDLRSGEHRVLMPLKDRIAEAFGTTPDALSDSVSGGMVMDRSGWVYLGVNGPRSEGRGWRRLRRPMMMRYRVVEE